MAHFIKVDSKDIYVFKRIVEQYRFAADKLQQLAAAEFYKPILQSSRTKKLVRSLFKLTWL